MVVLFVGSNAMDSQKGGVERVTNTLADMFEKIGFKVLFLAIYPTQVDRNDIRQYYLPKIESIFVKDNEDYYAKLISDNNIDVVVNQAALIADASTFVIKNTPSYVKIVSVLHNAPLGTIYNFRIVYADLFKRRHIQFLLKLSDIPIVKKCLLILYRKRHNRHYVEMINRSKAVVILSDGYREDIKFLSPHTSLEKIISIPNPISFTNTENIELSLKKQEVLYVGRVDLSQKKIDYLLKIWQKVSYNKPNWILNIVGGGEDLVKIKLYAQQLRLKNIYFHGFQDPKEYYKTASIFCLTSAYEGFPLVLIEAMQYGAIPIAFDSYAAVRDVIQNKKNGLLIPPFDIDNYAKELTNLMENTSSRELMMNNAKHITEKFSREVVLRKWLDILN